MLFLYLRMTYMLLKNITGNEILIPAIRTFIESFDSEKKIMILKPGEDLYDEDEN